MVQKYCVPVSERGAPVQQHSINQADFALKKKKRRRTLCTGLGAGKT